MAIDPVCGMEVDTTAKDRHVHDGTVYYFCCQDCKEEFAENPEDYVGNDEEFTS